MVNYLYKILISVARFLCRLINATKKLTCIYVYRILESLYLCIIFGYN